MNERSVLDPTYWNRILVGKARIHSQSGCHTQKGKHFGVLIMQTQSLIKPKAENRKIMIGPTTIIRLYIYGGARHPATPRNLNYYTIEGRSH